ncbi:hypothetical protein BCR44DRAFT_1060421 [Catenaria anguillulae PL171]|uniref:Uncharacterized protein n=1 Tax=Catenaria anguillulae PL171 TaxID=765915 RepID=A0A1Y2HQJ9_9FUNG|nr:hypothetical protein BCR44DRAFT_1060421 [Catenaria anguillulae PL171]
MIPFCDVACQTFVSTFVPHPHGPNATKRASRSSGICKSMPRSPGANGDRMGQDHQSPSAKVAALHMRRRPGDDGSHHLLQSGHFSHFINPQVTANAMSDGGRMAGSGAGGPLKRIMKEDLDQVRNIIEALHDHNIFVASAYSEGSETHQVLSSRSRRSTKSWMERIQKSGFMEMKYELQVIVRQAPPICHPVVAKQRTCGTSPAGVPAKGRIPSSGCTSSPNALKRCKPEFMLSPGLRK